MLRLAKDDAPDAGAGQGTALVAPKRPDCPPEQKQKVINSINAYVQSAKAARAGAVPGRSGRLRLQLTLSAIRV